MLDGQQGNVGFEQWEMLMRWKALGLMVAVAIFGAVRVVDSRSTHRGANLFAAEPTEQERIVTKALTPEPIRVS